MMRSMPAPSGDSSTFIAYVGSSSVSDPSWLRKAVPSGAGFAASGAAAGGAAATVGPVAGGPTEGPVAGSVDGDVAAAVAGVGAAGFGCSACTGYFSLSIAD